MVLLILAFCKEKKNVNAKLPRLCDSDWGGLIDDVRSTSRYSFSLSSVISWASIIQHNLVEGYAFGTTRNLVFRDDSKSLLIP